MRFLKADVDLKLLSLVLLMLAVFVVSSMYYQDKLKNMQSEYDEKFQHLAELESELLLKEESLSRVSELGESLTKDKEVLEINYLSLKSEIKNLEKEKDNLLEYSKSIPFSKQVCKVSGNAQCK